MAVSTIKKGDIKARRVTWSYNIAANGNGNTNLKTLIDNDLPQGYKSIGVVGFTTNDVNIVPIAVNYADSNYSLQLRNIGSSAIQNTVHVYYLCTNI